MSVPESYLEDASGYRGEAEDWFAPGSAQEVAEILARAVSSRTPVTVSGAGTGLTGGRVPHGGWVLSLERFRRLEVSSGIARAGAGVALQDLHAAARGTGQFYAPDPTETTASVGGTLATNASGSRSFRYGSTRRHVLALQVALMDGSVRWFRRGEKVDFPYTPLPAPRATKHACGLYLRENLDWVDLFIGSDGILGVILEAELTLLPMPTQILAGVVFLPSEPFALQAVEAWRPVAGLRMLEYLDAASLQLLIGQFPEIPKLAGAALLVEDDSAQALDEWPDRILDAGGFEESWLGESQHDRERFRKLRHALPEAINQRVLHLGFQKMGTDFAVPLSETNLIMAKYRAGLVRDFMDKSFIFGHIGDAHLHVNLIPASEQDVSAGRLLIQTWATEVVRLGGTLSAEHGLGKRKRGLLALEYSPAQVRGMAGIKRCLDPHWLLGVGTLLPPP